MSVHTFGEITIRPFDSSRDTPRVSEIVGEIWTGGDDALMEQQYGIIGGRPWNEWMSQSVLTYIQAADAKCFVAIRDGEVVGFCSYVIDKERSRGTVGYNGVARKEQGKRLGSLMMDFVMFCLRAEHMSYAAVVVADNDEHLPARRMYQKAGFHRIMGLHYMVQKL